VRRGDEVVAVLNRYVRRFAGRGLPVVATRDWHPGDHCSFAVRGGPWPPHCVAGTEGASFAPGLELPTEAAIVSKATRPDEEAYSAFSGTTLAEDLRRRGVRRLFVGGLATDYCVLRTVADARALGFEVILLADAIRAVDVNAGDGERATAEMKRLGATPAEFASIAG
jgi:nicotinamidase/pyrazinamidase